MVRFLRMSIVAAAWWPGAARAIRQSAGLRPAVAPSLRSGAAGAAAGFAALLCALIAAEPARATEIPRCMRMELPVAGIEDPPSQYTEFCDRQAGACILDGDPVLDWTIGLHRLLGAVNRAVNAEVKFISDPDNSGLEELWSYPEGGAGDCEDFALEKRRRLVAAGLPGAALTCAIAFHEMQFFAHAVLLAETTRGTWVLDNLHDDLLCWDAVPYFYTRREMPDGRWIRFVQP